QVLAPCGVNDYVCGRASEWIRNGTEFCHASGFAVKDDASVSNEEAFCYGGKASLDLIADSWKASPSEVLQKAESLRLNSSRAPKCASFSISSLAFFSSNRSSLRSEHFFGPFNRYEQWVVCTKGRNIVTVIRTLLRTIQSVRAMGGVYKGQERSQHELMTRAY
ncbi:hypothetical protein C1H46_020659, partial [Malus baccata]